MKKTALMSALLLALMATHVHAASIQYIDTGKRMPPIKITYSRDNGNTWRHAQIRNGQTFNVPRDATHLRINNIPYNPKKNYKVKEGNVS